MKDLLNMTASEARDRATVDWMKRMGLDYFLTVSFDQEAYDKYGLHDPEKCLKFTVEGIKRTGYRGPLALSVHDNSGGCYFHPHVLLRDNGDMERVRRWAFRYGDLDCPDNGLIRSDGAYGYVLKRGREPRAIFDAYTIGRDRVDYEPERKEIEYRNKGRR